MTKVKPIIICTCCNNAITTVLCQYCKEGPHCFDCKPDCLFRLKYMQDTIQDKDNKYVRLSTDERTRDITYNEH